MSDILSIFGKPQMLHSALVHLPIALTALGVPLLFLAAIFHKNQTLRAVAALVYLAAAAGAHFAAEAGDRANAHVPADIPADVSAIRDEHMDLGEKIEYAAAATAVLIVLSLLPLKEVRTGLTLLALVTSLCAALLTAYTGHLGGKLVYEHGIGIPHPASTAPPTTNTAAAAPAPAPAPAPAAPAPAPKPDLIPIRPIDPAAAKAISYSHDIKPLLQDKCADCHDADDAKGGFDITTIATMTKGGDKGGPGIVPGKPDDSSLVQYIRGEKLPRMPKKKPPLSQDDLHLIRQWIAAGATDDAAVTPAPAPQPEIPHAATPDPAASTAPTPPSQ